MLDEALDILTSAWSGEPVHHRGEHYTVDDMRFLPRPVQQPRVPVWVAGYPGRVGPLRRAARYDGFFPIELAHADQLAEIVASLTDLRHHATAPYDIAVALSPGTDPEPYVKAGATWWMPDFPPEVTLDLVRGVMHDGPTKARSDNEYLRPDPRCRGRRLVLNLVEAELRTRGNVLRLPRPAGRRRFGHVADYTDAGGGRGRRPHRHWWSWDSPSALHRTSGRRTASGRGPRAGRRDGPCPREAPRDWWTNTGYEEAVRNRPPSTEASPATATVRHYYHDLPRELAEQCEQQGSKPPVGGRLQRPLAPRRLADVPTRVVLGTGTASSPASSSALARDRLGVVPDEVACRELRGAQQTQGIGRPSGWVRGHVRAS